jgi:Transglutaminase-like superfamily
VHSAACRPLSGPAKLGLALRVWTTFAVIRVRLHAWPLPRLTRHLAGRGRGRWAAHDPQRLSRAVHLSLRVGRRRPACIVASLVLFRLLRQQGDPAELVIGLPNLARGKEAHAWVELRGRDVGPPPGGAGHTPLARITT